MGQVKIYFAIAILDNRKDKCLVHAANCYLKENEEIKMSWLEISAEDFHNGNDGKWSDLQTKTVADLSENGGIWADLLKQSVDATVRNMFRELIRMKDLPDIPEDLLQSSVISFTWKKYSQMVHIGPRVVQGSVGNLFRRFKSCHNEEDVMAVACSLTLE